MNFCWPNAMETTMGERLRVARESLGLSLEKAAERITASKAAPHSDKKSGQSVNKGRYAAWESGRNPVDVRWIPAICDVFACDTGFLFGEYTEKTWTASDEIQDMREAWNMYGGEYGITESLKELKEYEDAEEQGWLVPLPCKMGTRLYHAAALAEKVTEYTVDGFEVYKTNYYVVLRRYGERKSVPVTCIGGSYFFTREEAENVFMRIRKNLLI